MFKSLPLLQDTALSGSILKKWYAALLFCLFVFAAGNAQAQRDVILTQANEEIRCRILDETPTRFIYAYIGPKGRILRNEIFKNLVKDFKYNKYSEDLVKHSSKDQKEDEKFRKRNNEPSVKEESQAKQKEEVNKEEGKKAEEKKDNVKKEEGKKDKVKKEEKGSETQQKKTEDKELKEMAPVEAEKSIALNPTKKVEKKEEQVKPAEAEKKEQPKPVVENEPLNTAKAEESIPKNTKAEPSVELKKESSVPVNTAKEEVKKEKPAVAQAAAKEAQTQKPEVQAEVEKMEPRTMEVSPAQTVMSQEEKEDKNSDVEKLTPKVISQEPVKEDAINEMPVDKKQMAEVKSPDKKELTSTKPEAPEAPARLKWRVGVKGGIGNIKDNGFEALNEYGLYQEKLMKGFTLGGDLAFFPTESFGLGAVFTDFKSKNTANNLDFINPKTGAEMTGSITNAISRKFVGPALYFRKSIDFKTYVVLGLSPGMYYYSDKGDYNGALFDYRGKQFGGAGTLGIDFLLGNDIIGRDIILSLEAGYNYGRLNQLDYGDGFGPVALDQPIVMDRLDFSIGLRFMRFPKYLKNSAY